MRQTIEPVEVQTEPTPIVIPLTKSEESTVSKITTSLHGAAVDLPVVQLVEPGPLPTLPLTKEKHKKPKEAVTPKVKKSTGGLCASCFGAKAAEKKKKELTSETVKAPIEPKKVVEKEKKDEVPPTTSLPTPTIELLPPTTDETTVFPHVDIDSFQERNFRKSAEVRRNLIIKKNKFLSFCRILKNQMIV